MTQTISLSMVLNVLLILAFILPLLIFPLYFTNPQESSLFNISQNIPTISLAGGSPPESIIFTLFMHLISTMALPLYISIYISYKEKINRSSNANNSKCTNAMHFMNGISFMLGIIAVVCMYITGSVSVNYDFTAHFVFAVGIFIPGNINNNYAH